MKTEVWRWIVGGLLSLVLLLASYGFLSLEARVAKLEDFPERVAALETEMRLLREEISRFRADLHDYRK